MEKLGEIPHQASFFSSKVVKYRVVITTFTLKSPSSQNPQKTTQLTTFDG